MKRHKMLVSFVFVLAMFNLLSADEVKLHQSGFRIDVPEGWVLIPDEILKKYEGNVKKMTFDAPDIHYKYGFQPKSSQNWFDLPYILVQVEENGRLPQAQLENFEKYSIKTGKGGTVKGGIRSDLDVGIMAYDGNNHIIWMHTDSTIGKIGSVTHLMGITPTEKGVIQVIGFARKPDYFFYEPVFRDTALSVEPDSDLVYKWQTHEKNDEKIQTFGIAITCMISLSAAILIFILRRKTIFAP